MGEKGGRERIWMRIIQQSNMFLVDYNGWVQGVGKWLTRVKTDVREWDKRTKLASQQYRGTVQSISVAYFHFFLANKNKTDEQALVWDLDRNFCFPGNSISQTDLGIFFVPHQIFINLLSCLCILLFLPE